VSAEPLVVVVAGTGTEVGKTWTAAEVARELRAAGRTVRAHKPAQSFEPDSGPTDADLLAAATGQAPSDVCPSHRWYDTAMAPPMAAAVLGRPSFTLADLVDEVPDHPADTDVLLVESAGGVRSPLADDGDTVDLVAALRPDCVLLVGDATLGAINAVRLAVDALAPAAVLVFLNRFDVDADLHRRNRAWLADRCGLRVETDPRALAALVDAMARDKVGR
jgi:dethiobiotin synthetase